MAAHQPGTKHSRAFILSAFVVVRAVDTAYALALKFYVTPSPDHTATAALVFGLYRNLGAVPILFLAARCLEPHAPRLPARADAPAVLLLAATAVAATQVAYLQGLRLTNSLILATVLANLAPVASALAGAGLGRERLSLPKAFGVLLAIAGSLIMVDPESLPAGVNESSFLLGCALLVLSPLFWTMSLFVAQPLLARYPPVSVTSWNFALGSIPMAAVAVRQYGSDRSAWEVTPREALALAASVLFGCAFKFSALAWLLHNTEATLVCVAETAGHVATILASAWVLHEPVYQRYWGAAPVFVGCIIVALSSEWGGKSGADVGGGERAESGTRGGGEEHAAAPSGARRDAESEDLRAPLLGGDGDGDGV